MTKGEKAFIYPSEGGGSGNQVSITVTSGNYFNLEAGTIFLCVNFDTFAQANNYLFGYGDGTDNIKLYVVNNGLVAFNIERSNSITSLSTATGVISLDTQYTIRITWDSDGNAKLYVDDDLTDTDQNVASFADVPSDTLYLCGDLFGANRSDAIIDDVEIYNDVVAP